jgi:hypothetical protein
MNLITNIGKVAFLLAMLGLMLVCLWGLLLVVKAGNDRVDECTAKGGVVVYGGKCVKGV